MKPHLMRCFIVGNDFGGDAKAMLLQHPTIHFSRAPSVEAADMLLYTGGEDVSPNLYGEMKLPISSCNPARDEREMITWKRARRLNKFQVGFCRGSQFLNVMCGGKLWQDVNNHAVGVRGHDVFDLTAERISDAQVHVGSWHHQQCILGKGGELLAEAKISTKKVNDSGVWERGTGRPDCDVEAYFYPEHRCLGVQWHPEWGPDSSTQLFFRYIEKYKAA